MRRARIRCALALYDGYRSTPGQPAAERTPHTTLVSRAGLLVHLTCLVRLYFGALFSNDFSVRYARQTLAITNPSLMILEMRYDAGGIKTLRRTQLAYLGCDRRPWGLEHSSGFSPCLPRSQSPSLFGIVRHIQPRC